MLSPQIAEGTSVIRVYNFDDIWFVEPISHASSMLFFSRTINDVFEALGLSNSKHIIVNSLYGHSNVAESIANIISIKKKLNATLDFKMHDFNALCPSPHLSDFNDKYCGVPTENDICNHCLTKNTGWYFNSTQAEDRPVDIKVWRQPFYELFDIADTLTFFDASAISIVRKAFNIEDRKIRVIPHTTHYFKCQKNIGLSGPLHIGVLGTLTKIKGSHVIQDLYDHIQRNKLHIPITVVGSSLVPLSDGINIHGQYDPDDLIKIIQHRKINMILMPSIVPETFSYTLSEAMEMKLPIVAFDIGAQGNRVKGYKLGKVISVDSSSSTLLEALQSTLTFAQEQTT